MDNLIKFNLLPSPRYSIAGIYGETVQSEGKYAGCSAVFIIMAGPSNGDNYELLTLEKLMAKIKSSYFDMSTFEYRKPRVFVITGGEYMLIDPSFMIILKEILDTYNFIGSVVCVEDPGAQVFPMEFTSYCLQGRIHFTISPKKETPAGKTFNQPFYVSPNNFRVAGEIRLVIDRHLREKAISDIIAMIDNYETLTRTLIEDSEIRQSPCELFLKP